jgi:LAO/AO transport system kinase
MLWQPLLEGIKQGNFLSLARAISLVENKAEGYFDFLEQLPLQAVPVIGITGAPGVGKSTLSDALIELWIQENKKIGVLCVDPSSPFHTGALLGDRIRMSRWYNEPRVFIRSLSSKGSLGGLHPEIFEITDVMKAAGFHYIIIETVGVGQSEVEIASLAHVTLVVVMPDAGDEIQAMKSGLMEVADAFVVNKADKAGADAFVKNLKLSLTTRHKNTPIIKTIATKQEGLYELKKEIELLIKAFSLSPERITLLAQKAFHLIQQQRMKDVKLEELITQLRNSIEEQHFNLYTFIKNKYGI